MVDKKERCDTMSSLLGEYHSLAIDLALYEKGYFDLPASISYYGNRRHGLWYHSRMVAEVLYELTENNDLKWLRPESPGIIGLFHDLCKCDDYKIYKIGRPEGTWKFEKNPQVFMPGHGAKSVAMVSSFLQLTEEEMMCILFHMGAYTESGDWKYYNNATDKFPNVLWTHQADMIASHVYGI